MNAKHEHTIAGCQCELCKRHARLDEIKAKLPKEDANWLDGFANAVMDSDTEIEMSRAYAEELLTGIQHDIAKVRSAISS